MRGNPAVNDYPAAMTAVNHVEPVPRRIRAFLAGVKVLDTTAARYVVPRSNWWLTWRFQVMVDGF
jgi:hypothetical protein